MTLSEPVPVHRSQGQASVGGSRE